MLRGTAYRLFAASLLPPDRPRLARLRAAARPLLRSATVLAGLAIFDPWVQFLRVLRAADDGTAATLETEFARVFALTGNGAGCPPYESHYRATDAETGARLTALVEQEYATAGVHLNSAVGAPPDHAAVELEFMAFLCDAEGRAWEGKLLGDCTRVLERQRRFLQNHLVRWLPSFARAVAETDRQGFYTTVGRVAAAFIHHDADLIHLLLEQATTARDTNGLAAESGVRR